MKYIKQIYNAQWRKLHTHKQTKWINKVSVCDVNSLRRNTVTLRRFLNIDLFVCVDWHVNKPLTRTIKLCAL